MIQLELERVLCRLWLASKFNGANSKVASLVKFFGSAEEVYASNHFFNLGLTDAEIKGLCDKDMSKAKEIYEKTIRAGGRIVVLDDDNYPKLLKQAHNPPSVLYIKGNPPSIDDVLTIGVVGTREPSKYGKMVTRRICANFAKAGVVTVSGMAAGIDAVGAWATVREGGVAIGVIGSGIDIIYPKENTELFEAVTERGCIVSEFPPGAPPIRRHFPIRNRTIAGLSCGVLVTDAPERSGALITAKFAMEEGRDVFAVPRNISDIKFIGTNKLIQQGAKLVTHPNDIIGEYPYTKRVETVKKENPPERGETVQARKAETQKAKETVSFDGLTDGQRKVAELLMRKEMQIDEMARTLNMSAGELNTMLIMLEMKKIVRKLPGSVYTIAHE